MHDIFAGGILTFVWFGEDCVEMQWLGEFFEPIGGRSKDYSSSPDNREATSRAHELE